MELSSSIRETRSSVQNALPKTLFLPPGVEVPQTTIKHRRRAAADALHFHIMDAILSHPSSGSKHGTSEFVHETLRRVEVQEAISYALRPGDRNLTFEDVLDHLGNGLVSVFGIKFTNDFITILAGFLVGPLLVAWNHQQLLHPTLAPITVTKDDFKIEQDFYVDKSLAPLFTPSTEIQDKCSVLVSPVLSFEVQVGLALKTYMTSLHMARHAESYCVGYDTVNEITQLLDHDTVLLRLQSTLSPDPQDSTFSYAILNASKDPTVRRDLLLLNMFFVFKDGRLHELEENWGSVLESVIPQLNLNEEYTTVEGDFEPIDEDELDASHTKSASYGSLNISVDFSDGSFVSLNDEEEILSASATSTSATIDGLEPMQDVTPAPPKAVLKEGLGVHPFGARSFDTWKTTLAELHNTPATQTLEGRAPPHATKTLASHVQPRSKRILEEVLSGSILDHDPTCMCHSKRHRVRLSLDSSLEAIRS